jgi:hypothetical protein
MWSCSYSVVIDCKRYAGERFFVNIIFWLSRTYFRKIVGKSLYNCKTVKISSRILFQKALGKEIPFRQHCRETYLTFNMNEMESFFCQKMFPVTGM